MAPPQLTPQQLEKRRETRRRYRQRRSAKVKACSQPAPPAARAAGVGAYTLAPGKQSMKRRPGVNQMRGQGGFFGDLWDGVKTVGRTAIGAGIQAGRGALATLLGAGKYKPMRSVPKQNSLLTQVPTLVSSDGAAMVIRHREKIVNIQSSAGFQTIAVPLNPGLAASFPWLSGIAANFQEWRLNGMLVEYISTVAPYGGSDVNGSVVLSLRADDSLPAPTSLNMAENTDKSEPGRPLDNILMAVECAPGSRPVNVLQVRTGGLPSNQNIQFTDQGIVDISNSGQADANIEIGEVWFIYDVAFLKPIPSAESGGGNLSDHFQLNTISSTNNFGTTPVAVATNAIGGTCKGGAGSTYVFPTYVDSGDWLLLYWTDSGTVSGGGTAPTITNGACTALAVFSSGSGPDQKGTIQAPETTISSRIQMLAMIISVTGPSASVGLSGLTFAGTVYGDLMVTPWDANIITMSRNRARWLRHFQQDEAKAATERDHMQSAIDSAVARYAALMAPRDCAVPLPSRHNVVPSSCIITDNASDTLDWTPTDGTEK
jgi:hypothetical protein